eukprot:ctg_979.g327
MVEMNAPALPSQPLNLAEYHILARAKLPAMVYGYYSSGADDEQTLRDNEEAFKRLRFRPRVLIDVSNVDMTKRIMGIDVSFPLLVAPSAMQRMAHPEGELATARAVARIGTVMGLSSWSTTSLEDVEAHVPGLPKFFQLYVYKDRALTERLVKRAEKAGFRAIALTVDTPQLGRREADIRNRFTLPPHLRLANFDEVNDQSTMKQDCGLAEEHHQDAHSGQGRGHRRGCAPGAAGGRRRHLGVQPRRSPAGRRGVHHRRAGRGGTCGAGACARVYGLGGAAWHRCGQSAGTGRRRRAHRPADPLGARGERRGGRRAHVANAQGRIQARHATVRLSARVRHSTRPGHSQRVRSLRRAPASRPEHAEQNAEEEVPGQRLPVKVVESVSEFMSLAARSDAVPLRNGPPATGSSTSVLFSKRHRHRHREPCSMRAGIRDGCSSAWTGRTRTSVFEEEVAVGEERRFFAADRALGTFSQRLLLSLDVDHAVVGGGGGHRGKNRLADVAAAARHPPLLPSSSGTNATFPQFR